MGTYIHINNFMLFPVTTVSSVCLYYRNPFAFPGISLRVIMHWEPQKLRDAYSKSLIQLLPHPLNST